MAIFGKLWMSSVIQNKYFPLSYYGRAQYGNDEPDVVNTNSRSRESQAV